MRALPKNLFSAPESAAAAAAAAARLLDSLALLGCMIDASSNRLKWGVVLPACGQENLGLSVCMLVTIHHAHIHVFCNFDFAAITHYTLSSTLADR